MTTGPSPAATSNAAAAASGPGDSDEGFFSSHAMYIAVAVVGLIAGAALVGFGPRAHGDR